jgi:hypothetical protein
MRAGLIFTLILLAGCAQQADRDEGLNATVQLTGPGSDTVEVAVQDIPPNRRITAIELIDPNGNVYPARSLESETVDTSGLASSGRPTVGLGVGGGSGGGVSTGVGIGWIFGGGSPTPSVQRRTAGRVTVPDLDYYRQTVDRWRVAVRMADESGEAETFYIPAPRP